MYELEIADRSKILPIVFKLAEPRSSRATGSGSGG